MLIQRPANVPPLNRALFSLGPINEGEKFLDTGCGSGVEAIFAAMMTDPSGEVVGIDPRQKI